MSVEIIAREDRGASVDSSGAVSFSHVIQFEGDSLMEIVSSTLLPQRGSRHPQNTAFFLDSLEVQPNGNKGRRVQALATLNYSNSTELTRYYGGDPWDLGAQNVTETTQEAQIAFISGWDEHGNEIANVNSAGCRILSETTEPIIVLSFSYNLEAFDRREPKIAREAIINSSTVRVAGRKIPAKTGKLLPMEANYVPEYGAENELIREYWDVKATIQIKASGWAREELDVGTMAFFRSGSGELLRIPKNIYRYTPWTSKESSDKLRTVPKFGSIDDVIAAQENYAELFETDEEKQNAKNELPFEEITEPMPLNADGTLFMEAIAGPMVNPYNKKIIFDTVIGSWSAFDMPEERA